MYAIIETGGKQLKVEVGQTIYVEKLNAEVGSDYTFDKVLMLGGEKVVFGKPFVNGANVVAKVGKQGLGKKVTIYKYKSKAIHRRKLGHRQPYTSLVIKEINAK